MTKREQELQRQLDAAERRIETIERRTPVVCVVVGDSPSLARNSLQSISDWWHGGSSPGARSQQMRVNY